MQEGVAQVEAFIDHIAAGRIPEACELLVESSRATGAAVKLHDLSRLLATKYGQLVEREVVATFMRDGVCIVYAALTFQRGGVPSCAFCTPEGKIVSFALGNPRRLRHLDILRSRP